MMTQNWTKIKPEPQKKMCSNDFFHNVADFWFRSPTQLRIWLKRQVAQLPVKPTSVMLAAVASNVEAGYKKHTCDLPRLVALDSV